MAFLRPLFAAEGVLSCRDAEAMRDGDWGVLPYTQADIVKTLNAIQPYDWAGFLDKRLNARTDRQPWQCADRIADRLFRQHAAGKGAIAGQSERRTTADAGPGHAAGRP